jgi:glycosyltransferase involved in cell wall biosynthesis
MDKQSSIPFDQYQRYGMAARAIERVRIDGQPLTILEVGANTHKLLGRLLPHDRIIYLDREVPEEMRDQQDIILGDATELALPDGSFDVVVTLDVFEHIPADKREAFLQHTTRIARLLTVIGAPFDEPGVQEAEKKANDFWKSLFGYPYRWLAEHEEEGLPMLDWTKSKLDDLQLNYLVIGHGDLKLWTELITAHFAKEYVDALRPVVAELDRHYQQVLFDNDFSDSSTYRQFVFVCRQPKVLESLRIWSDTPTQPVNIDIGHILSTLMESIPVVALEKASEVKRSDMIKVELDQACKEIDDKSVESQNLHRDLTAALAKNNTLQSEISRMRDAGNICKAELDEVRRDRDNKSIETLNFSRELTKVHGSLSWNITKPLRKLSALRRRLMPPRVTLRLQPAHEINIGERAGAFVSTGNDPYFLLTPGIFRVIPGGRCLVRYRGSAASTLSPQLYVDDGAGFREELSFSLGVCNGNTVDLRLDLPANIKALRLDPLSEPGEFSFELFEMIKADSKWEAMNLLLNKGVESLRNPKTLGRRFSGLFKLLRHGGLVGVKEYLLKQHSSIDTYQYAEWIRDCDTQSEANRQIMLAEVEIFPVRPLISVVMPVYNPPVELLDKAIHSVRTQIYPNWELCIADDASSDPDVRRVIDRHIAEDSRIRVKFREKNGHISESTNSALELASGDFVAFLDHDDLLHPEALFHVAAMIGASPDVEVIYTDEDKVSIEGVRSDPFFKPDWSPHLAISQAYLGHLVCYKSSLIKRLGGLRLGVEGAQDHDLWLRAANQTQFIKHLPKVLYHWRMHAGSTASSGSAKPYAHEAGLLAVREYLKTRYPDAAIDAISGEHMFTYRARFCLPENLLVSIIIPTKDKVELLGPCIHGILSRSTWKNIEVIVLDNNSTEPETFSYFNQIQKEDARVRVVNCPIPFNWSRLNNIGAQEANGDVFVFLNNDTDVISEDWLEQLAGYALLPDVGTVGGLLLFDDGTIQHSGVVVGMNEWAEHVFRGGLPLHRNSPFVSPVLTRNVLAVTGACVAIARDKFNELGGFDEEFIICGSDVEIGLRAHNRKLFNVLCAEVRLYHYESKTRTPHVPENDFIQSDKKYAPYRLHVTDPFFNPNLDLHSTSPKFKQANDKKSD